MTVSILFIGAAAFGLALAYLAWRYWEMQVQITPEDEAFEARVADLNLRQANRLSDAQIRAILEGNDAGEHTRQRSRTRR